MTKKIKKNLYILGAGGFAREIYSYLETTDFKYKDYEFAGFLSDFSDDLDHMNLKYKIVGSIKSEQFDHSDVLIMGVSNCSFKKELFKFYNDLGIEIITYIHPTAVIGHDVSIGEGTVFCPYSVATTNISIGKCVTVNALSTLGHDVTLGDFCTLSGHCDITGNVTLENSVFLGSHASVIPHIVVESNAIIGAGSVVIKKVASGTTVFGNPAKKIK